MKYVEEDVDRNNQPIPLPHLHDEWLTKREINNRILERKRHWLSGKERMKENKVHFKDEIRPGDMKEINNEGGSNTEETVNDSPELSLADEDELPDPANEIQEVENPSILRRSTRKVKPIKRLLHEQTLFQEAIGPRRNGKSMRTSRSILEEGFQQRINTGHYNSEGLYQHSMYRPKKVDKNVLTLNSLKWENTVHAMKSSSSGIKKFIQVNYDDETIEEMRPDCLSAKLRKSDPDQPSFSEAMNSDEWEEYWEA